MKQGEPQAQLMDQAKVSKADAERMALDGTTGRHHQRRRTGEGTSPATIGPSTSPSPIPGITEVNVDAITGKVVAVDVESPKAEAKEKKQEKDDDEKGGEEWPASAYLPRSAGARLTGRVAQSPQGLQGRRAVLSPPRTPRECSN